MPGRPKTHEAPATAPVAKSCRLVISEGCNMHLLHLGVDDLSLPWESPVRPLLPNPNSRMVKEWQVGASFL